jgi:hypothetical protein
VELWLGTTRLEVVGLAAAVLTLVAADFLDFPAAGLEAAEVLGLRLLRPGRFDSPLYIQVFVCLIAL